MIKKFIEKNLTIESLPLYIIVIISFFLRFVNYGNRWGLAYDQAHDAILAKYAIINFQIPLVGPFASGAQFQTSGIWYWFLMIPSFLFPNSTLAPWVILTLAYVDFVFFMIVIGKELIDKRFGLLIGLFTAISTAQITQSTNLTLTAPMCFVSALAIFSIIKYSKTRKSKFLFLLGLSCGLAPTIHLQGILLILILPIFILIFKVKNIKLLGIIILGILIPLTPLLIFDFRNNFVNFLGLFKYFTQDQYKTSYEVLGRRWLTYGAVFWPASWALVIGGYAVTAYITIFSFVGLFLEKLIKRNVDKIWLNLSLSFIFIAIAMRYVRNPLFDSYLVFLHPFILLFTAFTVYFLFKKNIYLGLLLFALIVFGSIRQDFLNITNATNNTYIQAKQIETKLTEKTSGKKLALYSFGKTNYPLSLPLMLILYNNDKISDTGFKIGIIYSSKSAELSLSEIYNKDNYHFYNLNSSNSGELIKMGWKFTNPSEIYKSTQDWYRKSK